MRLNHNSGASVTILIFSTYKVYCRLQQKNFKVVNRLVLNKPASGKTALWLCCLYERDIFSHSCVKMGPKCGGFRHTSSAPRLRARLCGAFMLSTNKSGCSLDPSYCPPSESSFGWNPVSICGPALLFKPRHCPASLKEPVIYSDRWKVQTLVIRSSNTLQIHLGSCWNLESFAVAHKNVMNRRETINNLNHNLYV